jgi:hypothetical protein
LSHRKPKRKQLQRALDRTIATAISSRLRGNRHVTYRKHPEMLVRLLKLEFKELSEARIINAIRRTHPRLMGGRRRYGAPAAPRNHIDFFADFLSAMPSHAHLQSGWRQY